MKIWFQGLTLTLFALSTAAVVHADNGDPSIRLTTQLDKPVLLAGKKQTAHLKIGLAGVKIADKGERSAVNIALVIDRSGSMSGEKIRQAKRAAELAVGRMGSDDIVSVIAY